MYEEYIGKNVQVTILKDGQEVPLNPGKVESCSDGLLMLETGEVIEVETIVKIRSEPPMPFEQEDKTEGR